MTAYSHEEIRGHHLAPYPVNSTSLLLAPSHDFFLCLVRALNRLRDGLSKNGTIKNYEKIVEKIGRLREQHSRVSKDYSINVIPDENKKSAIGIEWRCDSKSKDHDRLCGVYCLRTNIKDWSEQQLGETYTILTEVEATFRSLKNELGLRPVYHQKEDRVTGHLFITLLAYHLVHTLRYQLKQKADRYKSIGWELGLPTERNRASAFRVIRAEITRLTWEAQQRPVLSVDEAHCLCATRG